ncbi:MAG: shikimate kinase [Candidatus Omnitrophica bacterium]|nr:shikimate kinase [Candidatus Omnitrophota bacterium]
MADNIYLVGFMGTGKSAVGRELAKRLKRHFIDLDGIIEKREKRQISEIFSREGEPHFRQLEKEALQQAARQDGVVVACGGGIVMDDGNIRTMKDSGKIICLSASVEVILERTAGYAHRPLLNVPDPNVRIKELLKLRAPFYARADHSIDTSGLSVKEVVEKIEEYLK